MEEKVKTIKDSRRGKKVDRKKIVKFLSSNIIFRFNAQNMLNQDSIVHS